MNIDATNKHFKDLNDMIRSSSDKKIIIDNCIGQRYIGSGISDKDIIINGTPGNAIGAYLNGAKITINGNAQDATGDTMNEGEIIINGSSGDCTGLALRGGEIYVQGNVGYRGGIHMKAYKEKLPILVVGGSAGTFLGEYLAGGKIIILGLNDDSCPVGHFCGTGMHGGKIFIRTDKLPEDLPVQVVAEVATDKDLEDIEPYISKFCKNFGVKKEEIMKKTFYVLSANSKNPYKQLYVHN
jgi:glutamate synthase domain-containing protein 3